LRLFKKLRRKLDYLDDGQIERIHDAYLLAHRAHRGQKRNTGEPYLTHPVAVAGILADLRLDYQTIIAALLHDVIEDTEVTKSQLATGFGDVVADLVDGVSKLTQIEFVTRAEAQAENFRKMVLAMARDIRVILVKLADRLHNMRTLGTLPTAKKQRISRETLEIYAPVAKRLGMREISVELEELGFIAMYPLRYSILKNSVKKARGNRKKVLSLIDNTLREGLANSHLSTCVVTGREKHLYSIYRKMRDKRLSFNDIMDVYAFRIIVDEVDTCYRALGVVHGLFKPVPERFKDYIAISKANGYQSLHTTLFGPYGLPIEIQIRTTQMDRMASSGIAAHWLYKSKDSDVNQSTIRAQRWVRNLLELQQRSGNSIEFIENVKVDLFPDEVYVFTPKGDIKEMPAGATALDFAFAVHTDIGSRCVAAKVDRKLVPLSTILASGQTVEVVTSMRGRPNPVWLDFLVTSKAKSAVRHYLKAQRREDSISLGKQLLAKALMSYESFDKTELEESQKRLVKELGFQNMDDLYADIGIGNRAASLVAQQIYVIYSGDDKSNLIEIKDSEHSDPLFIKGTEGMLMDFAKCCHPIPGDMIVGALNAGKGVLVHRERCALVRKLLRHPEQCIPLRWDDSIEGEFLVELELEVLNKRGILAIVALAVSDAEGNVEDIKVKDRDGLNYCVIFTMLIKNRVHLAGIIRSLRQVSEIIKINRI
jgi:GTP diphosphokinase / guanosine-3',5'-bis(diphosphate) 3'-diphosphatase